MGWRPGLHVWGGANARRLTRDSLIIISGPIRASRRRARNSSNLARSAGRGGGGGGGGQHRCLWRGPRTRPFSRSPVGTNTCLIGGSLDRQARAQAANKGQLSPKRGHSNRRRLVGGWEILGGKLAPRSERLPEAPKSRPPLGPIRLDPIYYYCRCHFVCPVRSNRRPTSGAHQIDWGWLV